MAGRVKYEYMYAMLDSKFDQIVLISETINELAEEAGVKRATIDSTMSRAKKKGSRCKYIRIPVEDEDEDIF